MEDLVKKSSRAPSLRARKRSQALVETALVLPILVGIVLVLFQFGVLYMDYLSVVHMTRDVGRWLAVHPDSTDTTVQNHVTAAVPPNILAGNLIFDFSGASSDWPWSPRCQSLSSGRCTSRASGASQKIFLKYNASHRFFLPSSLVVPPFLRVQLPTDLPRYEYHVMIESR